MPCKCIYTNSCICVRCALASISACVNILCQYRCIALLQALEPIAVKGKSNSIPIFRPHPAKADITAGPGPTFGQTLINQHKRIWSFELLRTRPILTLEQLREKMSPSTCVLHQPCRYVHDVAKHRVLPSNAIANHASECNSCSAKAFKMSA